MNNPNTYIFSLYKCSSQQNMLLSALSLKEKLFENELKSICIKDYVYSPDEAVEELGLDVTLIEDLIEDYVIQIVKSNIVFLQHLHTLQSKDKINVDTDYTALRELAHKNLGVAKNLRIRNAEKILDLIMKEDDLDAIFHCLEALFACVTILKPKQSFDTLRLIKVKSSF